MTKRLTALFLCLFLLTGCNGTIADTSKNSRPITEYPPNTQGTAATLGGDDTSVVWVHISNIRKKIDALGATVIIKFVRNAGYVLEASV